MEAVGYWLLDCVLNFDAAQAGISIGHTGVSIPEAVPREIVDRVFTTKKTGKTIANGLGVARGITTLGSPPHFIDQGAVPVAGSGIGVGVADVSQLGLPPAGMFG
jgi:hypothetical protein